MGIAHCGIRLDFDTDGMMLADPIAGTRDRLDGLSTCIEDQADSNGD